MMAASVHDIHYLNDVRWEYHDSMMLGDKGYLSAEVQKNHFETANITLEVPYRLNQKNWRPPSWAYKRFRKRIETIFSQLNDNHTKLCKAILRSLYPHGRQNRSNDLHAICQFR